MQKPGKRLCHAIMRRTVIIIAVFLAGAGSAWAATPGTLEANFASPGGGTRFFGAASQSDGKTVAVGESGAGANSTLLVARYTTSGALDPSFGGRGYVNGPTITSSLGNGSLGRAVAIQADGKIVVVGKGTSPEGSYRGGLLIERFNSNGSVDSGFGSGGVVKVFPNQFGDGYGVAVQPDGKIIATGSVDTAGSGGTAPRVAVVRLTSSGGPDASFGTGGGEVLDFGPYSYALAVALQRDGKIVLAGSQAPGLQVPNALIARLLPGGTPDVSFAGSGAYAHQYARGAASSSFNAIAVQSDGKIVAAGGATNGNTAADAILVRFTSAGGTDGSFGSGGVVYTPSGQNLTATANTSVPGHNAVVIAGNGTIVTAGTVASGLQTFGAVEAFTSSGALVSSFGSGGGIVTGGSNNSENTGLAIAPDGSLNVVGDTAPLLSQQYTATGARYAGFGAPPPVNQPLQVTISRLGSTQKARNVAKHGLGLTVACNQACSISARLSASAGTARQLRLSTTIRKCTRHRGKRVCRRVKVYRALTLARASARLSGAGSRSLVLHLSRAAGRAVTKQRRVRLTLQIATSSSSTRSNTISRTITLTR